MVNQFNWTVTIGLFQIANHVSPPLKKLIRIATSEIMPDWSRFPRSAWYRKAVKGATNVIRAVVMGDM